MKNKLINYFLKFSSFTDEEIKVLTDSMVIKKFEKDTFLVKEGQINEKSFFILEGLVRQFKLLDGEEITTHFYTSEQWILSLASYTEYAHSSDYLICTEDTTVVIGNEEKAQTLFKLFPRFETISRAVMETVFSEQQKMMGLYLTDSPEQRYLRLLNTRPDIFQKVPQYQLASYIGVKPESLSRIRKRITKTNNQAG